MNKEKRDNILYKVIQLKESYKKKIKLLEETLHLLSSFNKIPIEKNYQKKEYKNKHIIKENTILKNIQKSTKKQVYISTSKPIQRVSSIEEKCKNIIKNISAIPENIISEYYPSIYEDLYYILENIKSR